MQARLEWLCATALRRAAAATTHAADTAHAAVEQVRARWRHYALIALVLALVAWLATTYEVRYALTHGGHVRTVARCRFADIEQPLWPPECSDPACMHRFEDGEALRAFFANTSQRPLLVTFTTAALVPMVHHWACRARDAAQVPHVVALDGAACARLARVAPWVACWTPLTSVWRPADDADAVPADAVPSGAPPAGPPGIVGVAKGYYDWSAYLSMIASRTGLTYRLLALGHDLLLCDSDVVFAPNATLRLQDFVRPDVDMQAMQEEMEGVSGVVMRALMDRAWLHHVNFGFLWVRASPRTVALFQLFYREQLQGPLDDQQLLNFCGNLHATLRLGTFERARFVDGKYYFAEFPMAPPRPPTARMVVVHLTSVDRRRKLELMGRWGLWCRLCGADAPLPYVVDALPAGAPSLNFSAGCRAPVL